MIIFDNIPTNIFFAIKYEQYVMWKLQWIHVSVANVKGSAKFEHACSKHKLIHLWFCGKDEANSSWSLQPLCGPWATFFTWPIPKYSYIITIASQLNHMANHMHPYHNLLRAKVVLQSNLMWLILVMP